MARRSIRNITPENLELLPEPCLVCGYWEAVEPVSLHGDFSKTGFGKTDWYRAVLDQWGVCGKAVVVDDEALAYCQYAPVSWLPQARHAALGVSEDAIFLSCLYVRPDYRGRGLGKLLVTAIEKDLNKRGHSTIETLARRAPTKNPSGWTEFYLANGWQPLASSGSLTLLRVDLKSLVHWQVNVERVLERLSLAPISRPQKAQN